MDSLAKLSEALPVLRRRPLATAAAATVLYVLLVRALRFRRRDKITREYGYPKTRTLESMTIDEAHKIHRQLSSLEFPTTVKTSLFFALFKTYAIPSISKLLLATGQLSSNTTASKRAADTAVLMSEATLTERTSPRMFDSVARINFLHNRYRRSGQISDADMLYTLSLFALEPPRWARNMDWRPFSDVELCAEGMLWRDVGEALEIPYGELEGDLEGEDGAAWMRALERWSLRYEAENAVPDARNRKVAMGTLDILLTNCPFILRPFFTGVICSILEERTRVGMMLDEPTWAQRVFTSALFATRKIYLRYFSLPRPSFLAIKALKDEKDPKTGRYNINVYFAHPWYVKPTLAARWGPTALMKRMVGGVVPSRDEKYFPGGYDISELGPDKLRGQGEEEMEETRVWMRERRGMGCPMVPQ